LFVYLQQNKKRRKPRVKSVTLKLHCLFVFSGSRFCFWYGGNPDGVEAVAKYDYARLEVILVSPQGFGSSVKSDMAGRLWTTAKHFVLTIPVAFTFNDIGAALACTHTMHIKMRVCLPAYS